MRDLERAVKAVIEDCLVVKEGEDVLVVCNPATESLGERLRAGAEAVGAEAVLTMMAERDSAWPEPPESVAAAMLKADVLLAPTVQSLSHTAARKAATDAGARAATLPGVTEEMLARVMSADMEELRRRGSELADLLTAGSEARITCRRGVGPAPEHRGARWNPRRGRARRAGRLRQPALRGGVHLAAPRLRQREAGRRRRDRLDRDPREAGRARRSRTARWSMRPARWGRS